MRNGLITPLGFITGMATSYLSVIPDDIVEDDDDMPILDSDSEDMNDEHELHSQPQEICPVCLDYDQEVNTALIPYGHKLCAHDAEELKNRGLHCAVCRQEISGILRLFSA